MVDMAILTGSTAVGVGLEYVGLFGSEDARRVVAEPAKAAGESTEEVWYYVLRVATRRQPLWGLS